MAEQLTKQQEQAINDRGGKLLVSAAAGSGKTKVLVDRLLKYIMDPNDPANLDEFLIITYTQAAASELRSKIAVKLTEHIAADPQNRHLLQQLQRLHLSKISTVHSFCTDILRENAYQLDIPTDFRVAEENECIELQMRALQTVLDEAYAGNGDSDDFYTFIDSQGIGRDDRKIPEIILQVYKNSRCHKDPEAWLEKCMADLEGITDVSECEWGKCLIEDLHATLDEQIRAYMRCADRMEASGQMPKPTALFRDTVSQLMTLRARNSWDDISNNMEIDYGTLTFPRKCTDVDLVDEAKYLRNTLKDTLAKKLKKFTDLSAQLIGDYKQTIAAERGLVVLVRKFADTYDKLKRSRRIMDFSDLEHKALDLLYGKSRSGTTKAAREIATRFREIMVDEYQDSNDVQDSIFSALTEKKQNCFMVGDVKQSIYQFRLADPSIFIKKYNSYVAAEIAQEGQGRKVLLSKNFRSSKAVIDAVNDVFSACMSPKVGGLYYGKEEALEEGVPHDPLEGEVIELYGIDVQDNTYPEEAAFVANRIRRMLDGGELIRDKDTIRPVKAGDIAILLRSPNSTGIWYQRALESAGIRYSTENGENLFHAEENEVMLSLLKVIHNPLQDIPLTAVLLSRVFAFSADELAHIRSQQRYSGLYAAIKNSDSGKAKHFVETLDKLRVEAQRNTLSGLMMRLLSWTRLDSIYASLPDGDVRTESIQAFLRIVASYEQNANGGLSGLIEHLDLLERSGKAIMADRETSDAVKIMSIHKSKGLEFPVVFLCAMSREFNMRSLNAEVLCHKELGIGLPYVDLEKRVHYPSIARRAISACMRAEMVSEEMRVLYVAMTRAKDRLIMTYATDHIEKKLDRLKMSIRLMDSDVIISSALCPATWVWFAAILNRSGLWNPQIVKAPDIQSASDEHEKCDTISEELIQSLHSGLSFSYLHTVATQMPSKQTATQLKGRDKDKEAAENSQKPSYERPNWRKPSFMDVEMSPVGYGTAMHAVMQYICFERCRSVSGVQSEIKRLTCEGYISPEYAEKIVPEHIASFFASELGLRLLSDKEKVLREFKFSLLVNDGSIANADADDKILLQGVVDCALIEEDGITIIDFKSDRVTETTLSGTVEKYATQLRTYADALARIYKLPIKAAYLYFFCLDSFVTVS